MIKILCICKMSDETFASKRCRHDRDKTRKAKRPDETRCRSPNTAGASPRVPSGACGDAAPGFFQAFLLRFPVIRRQSTFSRRSIAARLGGHGLPPPAFLLPSLYANNTCCLPRCLLPPQHFLGFLCVFFFSCLLYFTWEASSLLLSEVLNS